MLILLLATAISSVAAADELYPFSGSIDVQKQSIKLIAGPIGQQWDLNVSKRQGQTFTLDISFTNDSPLFFDRTTRLKGAVEFDKKTFPSTKFSGRIVQEPEDKSMDHEGLVFDFDLTDGIFRVDRLSWAGLTGHGFINAAPPFEMDVRFSLQDVDLQSALFWMKDEARKMTAKGTISGFAQWAGTPQKLSVSAQFFSQKGLIQNFSYEVLSLHMKGTYPVIELAGSTVTNSNGFTFDIEGEFDFSSKVDLKTQFQSIQKIPLIKENALQSQWDFKRTYGLNDDGATETKFFLKKDKRTGSIDQGSSELFGMEKKIGF
ncbi:MAG: hypothetical protein JNN05_10805 [Candidatus Omnitrophica bacterium]|nr:hypothetical protein [Candidatus Omnitrophota bacterium]